MQNSWLFFPNLGLHVGCPFNAAAELQPPYSYNSERLLGLRTFLYNVLNHSDQFHMPGSGPPAGALASLSQVTGGFLFWLTQSKNDDPVAACTKPECSKEFSNKHYYYSHKIFNAFDVGKGSVQGPNVNPIHNASLFSVILARSMSFISRNQWTGNQSSSFFRVVLLAAAFVPPIDILPSKLLPIQVEDRTEQIMKGKYEYEQGHCEVKHFEERNMLYITSKTYGTFKAVVEPRTGINFPTSLVSNAEHGRGSTGPSQVLVGVGSRDATFAKIKSVKIYAFGLYVHPDCVCKKLGRRYSDVPPEELKNCPDFFEDLMGQDIWMTVRLVVHYKGLKIGMVRNAFENALRKRLTKIGGATDDGLTTFCNYFSRDISLSPGTTIDFHCLPGGCLRTEFGGEELGKIYSRDLCKAFFDLYVGEAPVSLKAKQDIGENIGRVIKKC